MLNDEPGLITAIHELAAEDFYDPKHQAIFNTITALYAKSIKPTFLEVGKEVLKTGMVTDSQYVFEICNYYITSETLTYWIGNIKEKAKRRQFKKLLLRAEDHLKSKRDIGDIISDFEKHVFQLNDLGSETIDSGEEMAQIGRQAFEEAVQNKGKLLGIHTGISKLNRLTGGWKDGDLIIIAAETGRGKTAFSLNFIDKACFWLKNPTLYINSEMSKKQVIFRIASIMSSLKNESIKFGELKAVEKVEFENAMKAVETAPFFHYHSPSLELKKTVAAIRKMKIQKNIKFVIVDYVGRMEKTEKDLKEWQVLEQIIKALKTLAQELSIPILVVAQLTDDQKLQGAKRMENEADIYMQILPMTDEQKKENKAKFQDPPNHFIYLKKNRDGRSDVYVPVLFKKTTLQVIDVAKATEHPLGQEVQIECPF